MPARRGGRAAPTAAQRAEWAAQREAKLSELQQRLVDEVGKLADGSQWRAWLEFATNFHTYSFNNTVLIFSERPDATWVGGFETWKKLGRAVRKGEKGIPILAPVIARKSDPTPAADAGDPPAPVAAAGTEPDPAPEPEETPGDERQRVIRGFRVVHVFDISQTDGPPIDAPGRLTGIEPSVQLLAGQAPDGLWDALQGIAEDHGYTVERGPCGTANGYTHYGERRIRVRADVDDAQAVKTMAHEDAHMLMHDAGDFGFATTAGCRGEREVEAESVAFLVAGHHGLDTSSYTFGYVTGWAQQAAQAAGTTPEQIVRATGQRVISTALAITEATDAALGRTAAAPAALGQRVQAGVQRAKQIREHAETATAAPPATPPAVPAPAGEPAPAQQGALFDVPAPGPRHSPAAAGAFPPLRHVHAGSVPPGAPPGTTATHQMGRRR
jgi:DNA primase